MLSQQQNPCTDSKSAQQCTTKGHPYHSPKLHSGLYSSVGMWRGTDRQTAQTALTTIHFASAMPHAKCNQEMKQICNSRFDNAKFTSFDHCRASTLIVLQMNASAQSVKTLECRIINSSLSITFSTHAAINNKCFTMLISMAHVTVILCGKFEIPSFTSSRNGADAKL